MNDLVSVLLGVALIAASWAIGWVFWRTIFAVVDDLRAAARRRRETR